jgi:AraC-like DNA-binding protein
MLARSSPSSWAALDPVSTLLLDVRVQGTFFCNSELGAPWVMEVPARDFASFHFVVGGECWLGLQGQRTRALSPGQLALVARSPAHRLGSQRSLRGRRVDFAGERRVTDSASVVQQAGSASPGSSQPSARTRLICGGLRFEGFVASALAALLPDVIVTDRTQTGASLGLALEAMTAEADTPRAGGATIMARLLDIIVVETIRSFVEAEPAADSGWLGALRDPQVSRALVALHERPEADWSLESMADVAGMSRSVFARRFAELLAMPPKHYLTRVRMHRALDTLRRESIGVAELAHRLGYASEAAFARAFKRHIGLPPSAARRELSRAGA